jgi:hypothetical protein
VERIRQRFQSLNFERGKERRGGGGESSNHQKVEDELMTIFLTESLQNYGSQHRFQLSNVPKNRKTCHVKKVINIYTNKTNYAKEACGREKKKRGVYKMGLPSSEEFQY